MLNYATEASDNDAYFNFIHTHPYCSTEGLLTREGHFGNMLKLLMHLPYLFIYVSIVSAFKEQKKKTP